MPNLPPNHGRNSTAPAHKRPRASSTALGYGYRWQQLRERWLRQHPLCEQCQAEGLVVAATEVDHRMPHKGDQTLFWSETNLSSLCKPHHSRKTAGQDCGFGNQPSKKKKRAFDADGNPVDGW